ncbi:hypothetical protein GCM10011351_08620 [Paraliobacillus quinghaiensis]|uniref:Spore germination protein GerPE n=1 Tax=Paraliobacillus quinghaiensis TaxID=470815 RepID=A0A917WSI0_9BACI|nr:spore germination protein GerPE [Paraliobacillus quinghaiensis]GGM25189.1 hypothetical protein GCM10011351_08620 [Paraliobacillus quinghaiensis]
MIRTTKVNFFRVNSVAFSSILEIGDATHCYPETNIIAVQKEGGVESDEGYEFDKYSLFDKQKPPLPPITNVPKKTYNHKKSLHVDAINITGVTSSGVVQLGNLKNVEAESRIKHIRILEDEQADDELNSIR